MSWQKSSWLAAWPWHFVQILEYIYMFYYFFFIVTCIALIYNIMFYFSHFTQYEKPLQKLPQCIFIMFNFRWPLAAFHMKIYKLALLVSENYSWANCKIVGHFGLKWSCGVKVIIPPPHPHPQVCWGGGGYILVSSCQFRRCVTCKVYYKISNLEFLAIF